jgi:hypothetical protein
VHARYVDSLAHGDRVLEPDASADTPRRAPVVGQLVREVLPFDYRQFGSPREVA